MTWLWAGDAEKAWLTFQDAMGVEAFAHTEEAFAADALFEAYRWAGGGGGSSLQNPWQVVCPSPTKKGGTSIPNPCSSDSLTIEWHPGSWHALTQRAQSKQSATLFRHSHAGYQSSTGARSGAPAA